MNSCPPSADPSKRDENSVKAMFAHTAAHYDLINRAMTFGMDAIWRKRLASQMKLGNGETLVADIACGSGDSALAIARMYPNASIKCVDFCVPMLDIARAKFAKKLPGRNVEFIEADCERLPFGDSVFDGAAISFGFRNFRRRSECLREIARVLKPNAALCMLEVSRAKGMLAHIQRFFMSGFVPCAAAACGGRKSDYKYLSETTLSYPECCEVEKMFAEAGLKNVKTLPMAFGFVAITSGQKRGS